MQFKLKNMPEDAKPYKVLPWDHIKNMRSTSVLTREGAHAAYRKIGWAMVATCLADDGIGLAAPQFGLFKKVFLIREFRKTEEGEFEFLPSFRMYLNPSWTGVPEEGKTTLKEWCLSVPGKGYPIERFQTIEATWFEFNEDDELVSKTGRLEHFPARIFLHEWDHLKGISIPQRWEMQNGKKPGAKKKKKRKRKKRK